ncbi:alpha/beta hydrolase [Streptomyces sp. WAC06614]|uniref:alpha/beta hydrolase n=1 Tax=Streptomyces sp. WAC06614 TaxID=2487416 RepID=UPI000F7710FD|nr:alpha/beta hydrolase [Streptomyces sp. WAC06614]RSS83347.1 alpha/beta fold hydrolase [Streptomyces sp. WAC06614]
MSTLTTVPLPLPLPLTQALTQARAEAPPRARAEAPAPAAPPPAGAPAPAVCAPAGVRPYTVDAGGVTLSGLLAEPAGGPARSTVLAVHGRGMRAAYWNSFVPLATALGHAVLAVDRPGYGASADLLPEGLTLAEQADTLHAALKEHARTHELGAGVFLLGHSDGGKVALHTAAQEGAVPLLGLDTSGTGYLYHPEALHFPSTLGGGATKLNWGPLNLYPRGTFQASRALLSPTPPRESAETVHWPAQFEALAPHVRIPVRLTFAEHELWWQLDEATLHAMASRLTAAPTTVAHLPAAGHNISLGLTAPAYHLRVLAFLEECLLGAGERG